jgi:hypothetical protein
MSLSIYLLFFACIADTATFCSISQSGQRQAMDGT